MNKMKAFFNKLWTYDLVRIFVYSIIIDIVIECFNRRGLMGFVFPFKSPVIFLYNVLIIMATMTIGLFFVRRVFVYAVVAAVWLTLAVVNFIILSSRKTPFTAMDFYLINAKTGKVFEGTSFKGCKPLYRTDSADINRCSNRRGCSLACIFVEEGAKI